MGRNTENEIVGLKQLYEILPFGEKKIRKLIAAGELPVVKIGRDYITTKHKINEWIEQNIGKELYY
ncbi:MAG: helix-turn-helix domain-containing protein [Candidatus Gastranaerophilaceae bacterium]